MTGTQAGLLRMGMFCTSMAGATGKVIAPSAARAHERSQSTMQAYAGKEPAIEESIRQA